MSELEDAARGAIDAALAAGASDAEAWCEEGRALEVRAFGGEVESLTDAGGRGVGVRAFASEGRWGYAFGTDLSTEGLRALAARAAAAAAVADPDEHAGLPEECGAADVDGLAAPGFGEWTTEARIELALEVERAARAVEGVSQVEQALYADASERVFAANSRGFAAGYETTSAYAWASAFAGEGADLMTGLGVGAGREPGDLDPVAIGAEAGERAAALRGARRPASRRCPVVLDTFVTASFIGFIGGMLSAEAAQRGRSAFAGRQGEEIGSAAVTLADDGLAPDGFATAPFDGEGSPRRTTALLRGGTLETFLFDVSAARREEDGATTTGNAVRGSYRSPPSLGTTNLVLEGGEDTLDALLARAGDGLLVTDVAGLHSGVNPVSGTFSVGASGRTIEGGELAGPVRELTIAGDLVSMLRSVVAVGSERRWVPFGGSVRSAPVLLAEMAVSGD